VENGWRECFGCDLAQLLSLPAMQSCGRRAAIGGSPIASHQSNAMMRLTGRRAVGEVGLGGVGISARRARIGWPRRNPSLLISRVGNRSAWFA